MATRSKNTLNLLTRFDSMLLDLAILIAQYPQFLEAFQPATSYTIMGKAGLNEFKQLAKKIKQLVPVALLKGINGTPTFNTKFSNSDAYVVNFQAFRNDLLSTTGTLSGDIKPAELAKVIALLDQFYATYISPYIIK